jgi:hypothetical protein
MHKKARQAPKSTAPDSRNQAEGDVGVETGRAIMQAVLAKPRLASSDESADSNRIQGVVIGTLAEPAENGRPMVYYPGIPTGKPLEAVATSSLGHQHIGHEVALGFVDGDPGLPIILGLIQKPVEIELTASQVSSQDRSVEVQLDGNRLTLTADREIVLKCGQSSLTLTSAGKVILKGAYVSTHSTGLNRIKGGSVQIN